MIALLAVLALIVSACAGSGGPEQPTATGSGNVAKDVSGTVRILMENVPDSDVVKSMVPDFNKDYPNVKVDIQTLTYDQMRDKLVSSFQSSSPTYDLVIVDNPWMVDFAKAKFLQPLDSRIDSTPDYDYADFFKPLTDIATVDGVRYGVPFYNYALGYLYNADDLAAAKLGCRRTSINWSAPPRRSRPVTARASRCSRSADTRSSRSGATGCSPRAAPSTAPTASRR